MLHRRVTGMPIDVANIYKVTGNLEMGFRFLVAAAHVFWQSAYS